MVSMSDREKAFENKYAHDQEKKFRVIARRNKLTGLWAAGLLGKADADAYARVVMMLLIQSLINKQFIVLNSLLGKKLWCRPSILSI